MKNSLRISLMVAVAILAGGTSHLSAQAAPEAGAMAAAAVETRPELVAGSCRAPVYPASLRAARMEGHVLFEFVVDTTGRVDASTVRTLQSTHSYFADAARRSLLSCRYRPGTFNNRAVRVTVQSPFTFALGRS